MVRKRVEPDAVARWAEESRGFRETYERRLRMAGWDAVEERRRARLRRLTFGLLGRA
jgi:hypothetical protein